MAKITKSFYCINEACSVYKSGKAVKFTADESVFESKTPTCPKCGAKMSMYGHAVWHR